MRTDGTCALRAARSSPTICSTESRTSWIEMMRALLDVNVLVALMDKDHIHHNAARAWWRSEHQAGWASCPLTQNGFVRVSCQAEYPDRPTAAEAIKQLRLQIADSDHEFWADDISIVDEGLFDRGRILGPRQLTDVYLLALAVDR